MVGNLDTVNAQEPDSTQSQSLVLIEEPEKEFTDYTSFQARVYSEYNEGNMFEIGTFVRGRFNYLVPVDFTHAGLLVASTHFSDKKEPFHLKMTRLSLGSYYENGEIESFTDANLMMNVFFNLNFLVNYQTNINSEGVESFFLPSVVYNNERFYIGSSGRHVDLKVNFPNFLLETEFSSLENFNLSVGTNLEQKNGVIKQVNKGYSFRIDYTLFEGDHYFLFTLGLK